MRLRAERRLGQLLKITAENGERKPQGNAVKSRGATSLDDLGIPKDRASRAMQLANIPEEQFEAALGAPVVAEPRRILREANELLRGIPEPTEQSLVPIAKTLMLWGEVRDFGEHIEAGELPPLAHWRHNMQPFQIEHFRRYAPLIIAYLSTIQREIEDEHLQ